MARTAHVVVRAALMPSLIVGGGAERTFAADEYAVSDRFTALLFASSVQRKWQTRLGPGSTMPVAGETSVC